MLAHPDAVREVFTGDPAVLHAGKAQRRRCGRSLGARSVLLLDGPRAPAPAQADAAAVPRHAHGRLPRADRGDRARAHRALAARRAARARAAHAGDHARRHAARDLRRRRRPRGSTRCATGCARMLDRVVGRLLDARDGDRRARSRDRALRRLQPLAAAGRRRCCTSRSRERRADAPGDDVLSLLLAARDEDGEPMSDHELRDELMTLLVAGHETTATALELDDRARSRAPRRLASALRDGGRGVRRGGRARRRCGCARCCRVVLRSLQRRRRSPGSTCRPGRVVAPSIYLVHRRPDVYPDPARVPARALPRPGAAGRDVHVDPVRRRHPPLPRRGVRADGDARRARRARRAPSTPPRPTPRARADRAAARSR